MGKKAHWLWQGLAIACLAAPVGCVDYRQPQAMKPAPPRTNTAPAPRFESPPEAAKPEAKPEVKQPSEPTPEPPKKDGDAPPKPNGGSVQP